MGGFAKRYRATIVAAVVIALIVAVPIAFMVARSAGGSHLTAIVHDGDGGIHELDLSRNTVLEVETSLGRNVVRVEDGTVFMAEADCPKGDCLRQHALTGPGGQIICLPHELWIEVVADGGEAGEMDVDAVDYGAVDTVAR